MKVEIRGCSCGISRLMQRFKRDLRRVAVKFDLEFVDYICRQLGEVEAVFGWDHDPPSAGIYRDAELISKSVHATKNAVDADLAKSINATPRRVVIFC